jgi:hypothetical protein
MGIFGIDTQPQPGPVVVDVVILVNDLYPVQDIPQEHDTIIMTPKLYSCFHLARVVSEG